MLEFNRALQQETASLSAGGSFGRKTGFVGRFAFPSGRPHEALVSTEGAPEPSSRFSTSGRLLRVGRLNLLFWDKFLLAARHITSKLSSWDSLSETKLQLEIQDIAFGGEGVGRAEDFVIFVPFTAVGDRVESRVGGSEEALCPRPPPHSGESIC